MTVCYRPKAELPRVRSDSVLGNEGDITADKEGGCEGLRMKEIDRHAVEPHPLATEAETGVGRGLAQCPSRDP